MELVAGMGEFKVSDKEEDIIRTFALASCVAITAYSPIKKVAGMVHVVLPTPLNIKDRVERPGYFAETGIPSLINSMYKEYGCLKGELQICIFGGAESIRNIDIFNVGKRNIETVIATLSSMGLSIIKAELSGCESRTLTMDVKTGTVKVTRRPLKI
jgi:chemotaxis protein CheD